MYKKILCSILALTCIFGSYSYQNSIIANAISASIRYEDMNISSGELFSFKGSGKLIIDKRIKSISSYVFNKQDITSVEVSEDNKYFKTIDGILYNKKMTKLIYYPSQKECDAFVLPDSVKKIEDYAFNNNQFLKNISIGKNVKNIPWTSLEGCKADFYVDKDSAYLESENGVLFTKGKKTLIKYPTLKKGAYVIPDSVKKIQYYAFDSCTGLTELTLNNNMDNHTFDMIYLNGCSNLEKLHFPLDIEHIELDYADFNNAYYGGYNLKSLKEITIPEENKKFAIYNGALYSKDYKQLYFIPAGMDKLVIHKDVEKINSFICQNKFTSVKISKANKKFVSHKGILYDKDMTEIVIFPSMITEYEVPASIKSIEAIRDDFSLYPESDLIFKYRQMSGNITSFSVEKGNKNFSAKDGVLYNKKGTILYIYPPQKQDKEFTIPDNVTYISTEAFTGAKNLEEINFSGKIKRVYSVFDGCTSLKKIVFNEGTETVCVYGNINKNIPLDIKEIYLPGTLIAIDTRSFGINKDVIFYGYKNTGDEQYATCSNMPIDSAARFIKQQGYNFKSLGTAPKAVTNASYFKNNNSIKISWKAGSKSDGYVVYKEYNQNLIAVKKIRNGNKYSCTIKNSDLKKVKKLYIRPYKKINGITVYGRKTELTIQKA